MIRTWSISRQILIASALLFSAFFAVEPATAAMLSGSFSPIAKGSNVNLSVAGPVDWVHWGLSTDTSIDRKEGVSPQIGDYTIIGSTNSYLAAYQYSDNWNSYSWSDGFPTTSKTNTTTGVWVYGSPINFGSGFEFNVPAEMTEKTLQVFVGVFAGKGTFEAWLSDSSAPIYSNATLVNMMGNGPGGVYTVTYAAGNTGATLNVKWKLLMGFRADANVTMQAAGLTVSNANNPPIVAITNPVMNAKFSGPAEIVIGAKAKDLDGTVSKVEFYDGSMKLGESTIVPFSFAWNNASSGPHVLTARAFDDLGASRASVPIDIFVNSVGGTLSGSLATPPAEYVNLTSEGTSDWAHWGLTDSNSFDHKSGVVPKINNFTAIGAHAVQRYTNNYSLYSWLDGTPVESTVDTPTGVFITGTTNGFELTAPADTIPRQLHVYVGLYGAQGNFQAYLSDASAPAYTDMSLDDVYADIYAAYTINYTAASSNQTLVVRFRSLKLYDFDYGNVTLQAATLQGGPVDAKEVILLNPERIGSSFSFSFASQSGRSYTVQSTDSFNPPDWLTLRAIGGDGSTISVTNQNVTASQKFYRVIAQ